MSQLIQQKDIEETYGLMFPSPALQREYNELYQAKKGTDPSQEQSQQSVLRKLSLLNKRYQINYFQALSLYCKQLNRSKNPIVLIKDS